MVVAADIGRPAIVRAADHFYEFIDGWRGTITAVTDALVTLEVNGHEDGQDVIKTFYLPPDQLEVIQ